MSKNLSKILLAGFLLNGSAFANMLSGFNTNNFYLGGLLGVNSLENKKDVTVSLAGVDSNTSPFISSSQQFNISSGDHKFQLGFLLGYKFEFSNFNLGVETNFNYNFGSDLQKINNWLAINDGGNVTEYNPQVDENLGFQFGLFLVPEYELSKKTTVFAKLGYNGTNFHSDSTGGSLNSGGPLGASGNFNKWANGLALGLGTNLITDNKFTVRFEYLYTFYSKFSKTSGEAISQTVATGLGALGPIGSTNANYDLSTSSFLISVIYDFGNKNYYK